MFWGQLTDPKSKKEVDCIYELCHGPIIAGEVHPALVARSRTGSKFTRHLHPECLWPYMLSAREQRLRLIAERRTERPGPTAYEIDDVQRKRRSTLIQYLSRDRFNLAASYSMGRVASVPTHKANILKHLTELNSGGLGPAYWFKFGPELLELYQNGADSLIKPSDVERADSQEPDLVFDLLAPGLETVPESEIDLEAAQSRAEYEQRRLEVERQIKEMEVE